MILPIVVKAKIEERTGRSFNNPSDKDIQLLADMIKEATDCNLGINTLKRLFGCIDECHDARPGTLNTIARFLGNVDWPTLLINLSNGSSSFTAIEGELRTANLSEGQVIEISYQPDRRLQFIYLGEERFEVLLSKNSKLQAGDVCAINSFILRYPLIVRTVTRGDECLGNYTAARAGGLTSVKVLS